MISQPPPARGVRPDWSELPGRVLLALEAWLGSAVVSASTQLSGFSPGVAARIKTEDGRRVFVKATAPQLNPDGPAIYRREGTVVGALAPYAEVPGLLWSYDEGEAGWVALVFEDVEGHTPDLPGQEEELDRVIDALCELSATLTPSPIHLRSASEVFATSMCGWRLLREDQAVLLHPWSVRHLSALVELEARAPDAVAGNTLLHLDVRADNLILTPDRVFVVDWPHACIGAAWLDLVCFAPSVAMQGGPDPETLLSRHPIAHAAPADAITAAVASLAGFFTHRALQPPPPGLPTVRAFQAAQGLVAREWLAGRTGWH